MRYLAAKKILSVVRVEFRNQICTLVSRRRKHETPSCSHCSESLRPPKYDIWYMSIN